ncbi:MAG: hypothetical protein M0P69_17055 [Bacteroidales bacterium]|nr:hypothetical protein [Bacteroidales bacterium]
MTEKAFEEPIEERIINYLLGKPGHTATSYEINQNVAPDYSQPGLWLAIETMKQSGMLSTFRDQTGQIRYLHVRLIDPGAGE